MSVRDIAERTALPQPYLEQILLALKGAGLVRSKRGVGGGYVLARPAEEIRLSEIVSAVDGPITLAFSKDIFDRFDFQNWYPNPSAETAGPLRLEYEFDPPPGDLFELTLDGPGTYPFVTHAFRWADAGARGLIEAE